MRPTTKSDILPPKCAEWTWSAWDVMSERCSKPVLTMWLLRVVAKRLLVPVVMVTPESMKEDVRLEQPGMSGKISLGLKEYIFFMGVKGVWRCCMLPRFLSGDTENLLTLEEEEYLKLSASFLMRKDNLRALPITLMEVSDVVQKLCSSKVPHGRRMRYVLIIQLQADILKTS